MSTTATREQIEQRVFQALEEFGAEPDQISADAEFQAMDVDSLDLVVLSLVVRRSSASRLRARTPRS